MGSGLAFGMNSGPGWQLQIKPLIAASALAAAGHLLMLNFETAVLAAWFRSLALIHSAATMGQADALKLLIVHSAINLAAGIFYAVLARPAYSRSSLITLGGLAAMMPNAVCTFAGALLVLNSMPGWITSMSTGSIRLPHPLGMVSGWLWVTITAISLVSGVLAAPLGMFGCAFTVAIRKRLSQRVP